ncbi:hypothetical protein ACF0H5_015449 [Mactra antiquata]
MTCVFNSAIIVTMCIYCVNGGCLNGEQMDLNTGLCSETSTNNNSGIVKTENGSAELNNSLDYNSTTLDSTTGNYSQNSSTFLDIDVKVKVTTGLPYQPKKNQHLTIIIVGGTAAVSIALFLCIAYYFHNAQLNKKAKRLSFTIYVSPEPSSDSIVSDPPRLTRVPKSIPNSPRPSLRLSREASPAPRFSREASPNAWLAVDNGDVFSQRRKSTLTANTLSIPSNIQGKRGSQNWNAFADHEILTLSAPRRHSTFII